MVAPPRRLPDFVLAVLVSNREVLAKDGNKTTCITRVATVVRQARLDRTTGMSHANESFVFRVNLRVISR